MAKKPKKPAAVSPALPTVLDALPGIDLEKIEQRMLAEQTRRLTENTMPRNLLMVDTRSNYFDYSAEFALRGLRPPWHLIGDDLEKLQAAMTSWMRGLPLSALADLTEHMHAQAPRAGELN
jgi:hypothetical protein